MPRTNDSVADGVTVALSRSAGQRTAPLLLLAVMLALGARSLREAVVAPGGSRIRPHFGVGYTLLRPRFQVDFTNAAGSTDRRQVNVDLQRVALFAGATWQLRRSSITAEAYATPQDAVTARLVVRTLLAR